MTITKTIGTGGTHDYTSISAWESDTAAIPTTLTQPCVGQCFFNGSGDGEMTDHPVFSGHTTSSSNTITLTTGAGQSFRDNANVRTNALKYNASNGFGLTYTSAANEANITLEDSNMIVSNIQMNNTSNTTQYAVWMELTADNLSVNDCILTASGASDYVVNDTRTSGTANFRNTLFAVTGAGPRCLSYGNASPVNNYYFCTFVAPSDNAGPRFIFNSSNSPTTMENCAIFGWTSLGNLGASTFTTCFTDTASPPSGATQTAYSTSSGAFFGGITTAAADWKIVSGSSLRGAGTADSTNGATDISGVARPQSGNWDVGAWEILIPPRRERVIAWPIIHT